jgi:hypothetical protein
VAKSPAKLPIVSFLTREIIDAGLEELDVIRGHNHEALLRASDALYPLARTAIVTSNPSVVDRE